MADDGTAEQDINLAIVRKCEAFAGMFGIHTLLTRTDGNSIDYDAEKSIRANRYSRKGTDGDTGGQSDFPIGAFE